MSKNPIKEQELEPDRPSIYIGETSRTILERSKEHWEDFRGSKEDSHIIRHQKLEHTGGQPNFVIRVVGSHRTALARQVSEAVRIRRRGGMGSILNSKAEYNRCHIPRLKVEEGEEAKNRKELSKESREQTARVLDMEQRNWEQKKTTCYL